MREDTFAPFRVNLPSAESSAGLYTVESFTVPDAWNRKRVQHELEGRGVPPGVYTRLLRNRAKPSGDANGREPGMVVMSDTPAELEDAMDFYRACESFGGRGVLIHGLGIGCTIRMALHAGATNVTVVEKDEELMEMIAPHYSDSRVEIVLGDCLTYEHDPAERWGVVWHDIWDLISSGNLGEMRRLNLLFGRRSVWQGSWCQRECRELLELENGR